MVLFYCEGKEILEIFRSFYLHKKEYVDKNI
jgi:hypothetical protein